jgi:monovalent cation:H+ antiporter, CPA1 family
MGQFIQTETLIVGLVIVITMVAIAVRGFRVPYTVALVLIGLLISTQSSIRINLTPELILALFVPPLVFEGAFHINFSSLRKSFLLIVLLAIPGVVLATMITGFVLTWATGIGIALAFLFGTLMAATDPVAVVALFRTLGVPRQLSVLVEGESLLNDGTAIVLFNLVLGIVLSGNANLAEATINFLRISTGGLIIGSVLGWIISRLIAAIDDYLIETTLTIILAFGSYLLAERLLFSGVLAVVAAGLVCGNIGPKGMSPTTKIVLYHQWEYLAFVANSLIFLLIGMAIDILSLINQWQNLIVAILGVFVARVIVVYGLSWIANRFKTERVSLKWQAIIVWGGLRGAICLALVLSLPSAIGPIRDQLQVMAFGVVLFTLLIQSTTMRPLVKALRIIVVGDGGIPTEKGRGEMELPPKLDKSDLLIK